MLGEKWAYLQGAYTGGGAYTQSSACVGEKVGLSVGGGAYRWRNTVLLPASHLWFLNCSLLK